MSSKTTVKHTEEIQHSCAGRFPFIPYEAVCPLGRIIHSKEHPTCTQACMPKLEAIHSDLCSIRTSESALSGVPDGESETQQSLPESGILNDERCALCHITTRDTFMHVHAPSSFVSPTRPWHAPVRVSPHFSHHQPSFRLYLLFSVFYALFLHRHREYSHRARIYGHLRLSRLLQFRLQSRIHATVYGCHREMDLHQ